MEGENMKKLFNVRTGIFTALFLFVIGIVFVLGSQSNQMMAVQDSQLGKIPQNETAGGQQEGVDVQGHWMIEVLNEDGTVAQKKEFENALQPGGKRILSEVLTGKTTPGNWSIVLLGEQGLSPCEYDQARAGCFIVEDPDNIVAETEYQFPNLSVTAVEDQTSPNYLSIVLSGSATASFDGNIQKVQTKVKGCVNTVSPSDCTQGSTEDFFTSHTFSDTEIIDVVAGQQINVTVVLSFD
ncbi:MAG: hypothetical protein H0Z33_13470 [Bacillaceae bacterium]|nr:hypothetical protein [Bacillaceae bacterium]